MNSFGYMNHVLWVNWKQECVAGIIEEAKSKNIPLVLDGVKFHALSRHAFQMHCYGYMFVRNDLISCKSMVFL